MKFLELTDSRDGSKTTYNVDDISRFWMASKRDIARHPNAKTTIILRSDPPEGYADCVNESYEAVKRALDSGRESGVITAAKFEGEPPPLESEEGWELKKSLSFCP